MRIPDFLPKFGYENLDVDEDGAAAADPLLEADMFLSRRIAEVIERHYFGQPFHVKVSHAQGVVMIKIDLLMGADNWWVVHINDLKSDPGMRHIVKACGEILERYQIPRTAYDREAFIAAHQAIPLLAKVSGRGFVPT